MHGRCGRSTRWCLVACIALLAAGCSSIKVLVDYDTQVPFERYDTFDWLANRPNVSDAAHDQGNPLAAAVYEAVAAELGEKGMTRDEIDPDVLVTFYAGNGGGIDVGARGYRYTGRYGGWGGPIDVFEYRQGTLVLDVIEARTMELVWRAAARDVLDEDFASAQSQARVAEAVKRMVTSYPPAR